MRRLGFRIPPLAPSGKSSARFEHSTDNREAAGSTPASRTNSSCGQVNRCHAGLISHASGVQLASPQPVSGGSRSTVGPLACNQPMKVRFPPLPPVRQGGRCGQGAGLKSRTSTFDSCSWHQPWNARNGHERPARSSVTVAEWLRRQTVDLSTRVRFPPVTPFRRASFNG
jgi:hypothetical protein